jgi:hypothetical protein
MRYPIPETLGAFQVKPVKYIPVFPLFNLMMLIFSSDKFIDYEIDQIKPKSPPFHFFSSVPLFCRDICTGAIPAYGLCQS